MRCTSSLFVRFLLAASIAIILCACAGPRPEPLMPTPAIFSATGKGPLDHIPETQRWKPRRVYYATSRERIDDLRRIDYGNDESDRVSVGMAMVGFGNEDISWSDLNRLSSVPEREEIVNLSLIGLVEAGYFDPESIQAGPANGAAAWLIADLNGSIEAARDKDLLIYVHGAKVDFYNACVFAAQLDHFMGRDMTSLAFAWPTRQNIISYGTGGDVRRAYRHSGALTTLLERLARDSVARRIHIVAWSAGGRVVTQALRDLHDRNMASGEDLREKFRIGTVYMAATDVPGDEFIEALPAINATVQRVVATGSSNDGALKMGSLFMGGDERLGMLRESPLTDEQREIVFAADRLEYIDVSMGSEQRGFDITGHRYWFNHPWSSSDLILAIRTDATAEERGLAPGPQPMLWTLPPDYLERIKASFSRPGIELRRSD